MSAAGRRHWRAIAPTLTACGILTAADQTAFALLCDWLAIYAEASDTVRREGFSSVTKRGNTVTHPAARTLKAASEVIVRLAAEFGLTAASRSRLSVEPVQADKADDALRFARQKLSMILGDEPA